MLRFFTFGCAAFMLVACQPSADNQPANGRIALQTGEPFGAEIDLTDFGRLAQCKASATPSLQIGVLEGAAPYELGEVPSVTRLRDGGIALVNRSTDEVRVFDPSGKYRYALGRRGQGPGEFEDPIQVLSVGDDTLLIWDWGLERIVAYGPDGRLLRTVSVRPVVSTPREWLIATTSAGPYWIGAPGAGRRPIGEEIVADSLDLRRVDASGVSSRTPVRFQVRRWKWVDERARMSGSPLFDRHTSIAGAPGGFFVADGETSGIEYRDTSWVLRGVIRWRESPRRITPADVERFKARTLSQARTPGGKAMWEKTWARVPVADSFPSVDRLIAGRPDGVWARRPRRGADTAETWWGFSGRGQFICTTSLPADFRVREFGPDWVIGVSEDETGMNQVKVFALSAPVPSRQ